MDFSQLYEDRERRRLDAPQALGVKTYDGIEVYKLPTPILRFEALEAWAFENFTNPMGGGIATGGHRDIGWYFFIEGLLQEQDGSVIQTQTEAFTELKYLRNALKANKPDVSYYLSLDFDNDGNDETHLKTVRTLRLEYSLTDPVAYSWKTILFTVDSNYYTGPAYPP